MKIYGQSTKFLWFQRYLKICEICVICVPNNFCDFRVTNICLSARIFVPLYSRRTYISMQQDSITSLGRAELAQKYFPFIQPQSAWLKLKSLLAEDPDLEHLLRLKRRTFLPSEVANIYASLGHPWPPGPPPLRGGRERSSPLWPPGPPPLWGDRERSWHRSVRPLCVLLICFRLLAYLTLRVE